MWAKSLLLSVVAVATLTGASASAAPATRPLAAEIQADTLVPVQYRDRGEGQQSIRPLREVVEEIRSRFGGELISARLEDGGRPTYVLRWRMPDGQVRDFRVDAAR